jgi:ubiquinone/menaquinone biosynthesis C-methylase UbiE
MNAFDNTIAWYDKHANEYAKNNRSRATLDQINEFAALLPKGAKVLDAGCASGRDTSLLSKKGLSVIGIDISKGLINVAKQSFPDLNFTEGNFLNLPFEKNSFDGVWAHASLVHFETLFDVKKSLSEFYRVLKIGGILHVLVKSTIGKNKTEIASDGRFFQYFSENEFKDLLQEASFNLLLIRKYSEANRDPKTEWVLALAKK